MPCSALLQRKFRPLTPYHAKNWLHALREAGLLSKYPAIYPSLSSGFYIGIPPLLHTNIPLNSPTITVMTPEFQKILEHEFASGCYLGLFTRSEVKDLLGPF